MENWKAQAKALFFVEHLSVNTISMVVKKTRETVSRYVCSCPEYSREIAFRREQRKAQRKKYQADWDKNHRRYSAVSGETMRKEHDDAVKELSRERYYN